MPLKTVALTLMYDGGEIFAVNTPTFKGWEEEKTHRIKYKLFF